MNKPAPSQRGYSTTCHHCGYDMHDRWSDHLCPECATPFNMDPDAYTSKLKLTYPIALAIIAIAIMPFISLFSFVLMIPTYITYSASRRKMVNLRIPEWAYKRLKINGRLMWFAIAEFWALMIIHTIWPQALNWW